MQSKKRTAIRAGLLWAMGGGLLVVACAAGLALHGDGLSQVMDCWVALLAVWVPTAVSWLAVYRVRLRRPEVLLAAAAVTAFTVGNTYYVWVQATAGSVPFPSPADVGSLFFYPLMLGALAVTVRRHAWGWRHRCGGTPRWALWGWPRCWLSCSARCWTRRPRAPDRWPRLWRSPTRCST